MTLQNVVVREKLGKNAYKIVAISTNCKSLFSGGNMYSLQNSGKVMTMLLTTTRGL